MAVSKKDYQRVGLQGTQDYQVSDNLILKDFPVGKFDVIYLDPPWSYDDKNNNGERGADHKYDTMSLDELRNMPIADLLKEHGQVWMWHTTPFAAEAHKLAEHWGLECVTRGFLWVKRNKTNNNYFKGLGRHTRGNPEDCYLYRLKGAKKLMMPDGEAPDELIVSRVREHSRKPDEAVQRLDQYCGDLYQDKLELFSRQHREGWVTWGNDSSKFDE
ncbi:DNA methyltransferase [Vibrio phage SIO-2]|uniref:DNA methyltransferase n=1 Tax=Vibrio phage SIO-2 TaxID=700512 RepID=UPI0002357C5F|nr:DNA methyltransferase [Vibrio phage SIO-2]AET42208.1 hypothetical protein VPEG_00057 [Vibrio phage SIO-2]QKE60746.1 DNA methyltransferase [Vibrio phage vB_VhaS-VHB1]